MTDSPGGHCPGCHGYIEPKYLERKPCPGAARTADPGGLRLTIEQVADLTVPASSTLPWSDETQRVLQDRLRALALTPEATAPSLDDVLDLVGHTRFDVEGFDGDEIRTHPDGEYVEWDAIEAAIAALNDTEGG